MKDYTVTLTATIQITAKGEDQAEDRSQEVQEWLTFSPPKRAKWAGDFSIDDTSVEEA